MSHAAPVEPDAPSGPTTTAPHVPSPWGVTLRTAAIAAAVLAVVVIIFAWPAVSSSVKSVPLVVAGEGAPADTVAAQLAETPDQPFEITRADDRDAAVRLIEEREAFGAVVAGPDGLEVLTASANGVAVSQVFAGVAEQLGTEVTDVVPLSSDDPRGSGLTALALPLTIGGMIGGVLVSILVRGTWRRLAAVSAYAVLAGAVVVLVGGPWLGALPGPEVLEVVAVAASVFSISGLIVGLTSLVGPPGIAVAALLTVLVGNPLAGATQPWQFLPEPWGAVGQLLPPGAGATLLRDVVYFPEASTLQPWLVLAAWSLVAAVAMTLGHRRLVRLQTVTD